MKYQRRKIVIKSFFFLSFLIFGLLPSYGQNSTPENFWIHFDRPFYLTGETIWYKVYNTNFGELEEHSKVIYLNIHDKLGSLIHQQRHEIIDGNCNGNFTIPINWREDYYYITCFSKMNLQFAESGVYIKKIPIYNSFASIDTNSQTVDTIINKAPNSLGGNNVEILMDNINYRCRQKVKFRISSDIKGSCSVVIKELKLNTLIPEEFPNNIFKAWYPLDTSMKIETGLSFEGVAKDPNTKAPVQSDVLMLYKSGTNNFIRLASKNGHLVTPINSYTGEALFQIFNMNPFQSELVEIEIKSFGDTLIGLPDKIAKPSRSEELSIYLNNIRLRKNITEIFSSEKIDSLTPPEFIPIPLNADKIYEMNKYKSMATLEEFLKEIVILVELRNQNVETTVRLKNSETKRFFMEKPWYLVDGLLTRNEKDVLNIPFKNLVRLEILNTNESILSQLDPVMIRSGMIVVYTDSHLLRNSIDPKNVVKIKGFNENMDFKGPTDLDPVQVREHPDFSSIIYWNPNINLPSPDNLHFVTSDLQGDFCIEVHGYSSDGKKLYGAKKFSVKY